MPNVMLEHEWPHGLRCGECDRVIAPGALIVESPVGVTDDGNLIAELVCEACGA